MIPKHPVLLAIVASAAACADAPPTATANSASHLAAARAPGGGSGPRYKLRFISGVNALGDGEIQSGWFPDTGVVLNTKSPWKSLTVRGATIDLVNYTNGRWTAGTCATFSSGATVNTTTWDVGGNQLVSFQGRWFGTLSITQTTGTSVAFDGDRVVNGVVTPASGGIHNVVTNANQSYQTKDASGTNGWFRLEIRDAALKFGAASTTDGVTNPVGAEVACANFTIEARQTDLITP